LFKLNLNIPDVLANFNVDTIFCLAAATKITNKSQGGLTYLWNFGDGDTSSAFEPNHIYSDTGKYTITLVVKNLFSCTQYDTISKPITVYNHTNLDFVFDSSVCINNIAFTVKSKWGNKFTWYFGDSATSNLRNPVHAYRRDTGSYTVILYADSGTACENKVIKTVRVKKLPVADFTYTVDTCRGRLIFTNLSVRSDKWLWEFGDSKSSGLKNPVHDYLSAGNFNIILFTEPGTVCADTATDMVQIKVPKANAIVAIDTCNLKALLINPSRYLFNKSIWYFGDGDSLLYHDSVMHEYPAAGLYTIRLIANAGSICEDTVSKTILIPDLPLSDFNFTRKACSPYVLFENISAHTVRSDWDFGKGFYTNNSDSFIYKFDTPGQYIITLISYSQALCKDTLIDTLKIDKLALADFNFETDTCSTNVKFINLSTKSGSYLWYFGDQKQSNTASPQHSYDSSGSYLVTLIVKDSPCNDSITKLIHIFGKQPFSFDCYFDTCSTKIRLKPTVNNAFNYFWQLGDGKTSSQKNLDYIYANSGVYDISLIINRDTVCTDSVSKEITVFRYLPEDIKVPNIFTPNNDGVNELFTVSGLNIHCDTYKLWIYNRWGELIFESFPNHIEWDGKTDSKIVSPGTYYFILQGIGFEKVGTVTVVY
jgi:gliding motility-associated-like protein